MAVSCPACRAPMERRTAKGSEFWACTAYPRCRKAVPIEGGNAEKAWRLVSGLVERAPGHRLVPIARALMARWDRDPARAASYVLGETGPTGHPTIEALLRADRATTKRATPKRRVLAWDQKLIGPDPRKGIQDYEPSTRPAEVFTEIVQDETGGPVLPSSAFKPHRIKFPTLNPVQSAILPWADRDVNIVVAAATSAGKTTIAEMVMADGLARDAKAIFLSPLRAVSQEKYDDWRAPSHPWSTKSVEIITGDYTLTDARKKALKAADIVVMTSEMLDSKSRRLTAEGNDWLLRALILVVDEAHLLTMDGRGDALECGLMRFTLQNPQARVVLLSATMPNVDELGRWLTHLNGKPTVVIRSAWRPTSLTLHWPTYFDKGNYHAVEEEKRHAAMSILKRFKDDKFIVFVHSKKSGHQLLDELRERGESAEFHNADLGREQRLSLEKRFREGRLRIVIATSTLAWGINMPARRVIVLGVHRGLDEVDPIDVKQMVGRAGRMGLDPAGDAYILVPESKAMGMQMKYSTIGRIESKLNDVDVLAFHLTAEVAESGVDSDRGAVEWHLRSLASFQGQPLALGGVLGVSAATVMEKLATRGILKQEGTREVCAATIPNPQTGGDDLCGEPVHETPSGPVCKDGHGGAGTDPVKLYKATMLGRVSSWLYFSPFDCADWASNFRKIVEIDRTKDDACLAWALGCVKTAFATYLPREHEGDMAQVAGELRARGLKLPSHLPAAVLGLYGALQGIEYRGMVGIQRGLQNDIDRIIQAVEMIDRYVLRSFEPHYPERVAMRVRYGCGWTEADLCRLPGVGAKRARLLVKAGLETIEEIAAPANRGRVVEVLGPKLSANVLRGAKGLLQGEKQGRRDRHEESEEGD